MGCLPHALAGRQYYEPTERGFEREIKRRLDDWDESRGGREKLADAAAQDAWGVHRVCCVAVAARAAVTLRNISSRTGRMNEKR